MRAGALRHRVTVEDRSTDLDAAGQPVDAWATVATPWAAVEPLRGRTLLSAREAGSEATHEVRMRFDPAMRDGSRWKVGRIVMDGRHFYPDGPPRDVDERGRTVLAMVVERTDRQT